MPSSISTTLILTVFSESGWFIGTVVEVNEEEDLRLVKFDGEENKPTVAVTVEELDSRFEKPELGDIRFRFAKKMMVKTTSQL